MRGVMAQQRRVQLCTQRPTSTVCVLGTELSLDIQGSAPKDAIAFHVQGTPGVKVYVVHETQSVKLPSSVTRWPLATGTEVLLTMEAISKDVGDEKVRISYFGEASGVPVGRAMLYLTCVDISLDADTGRNGSVSKTLVDKATWTWGPDGHGAILLVNCDCDDPKSRLMGDSSEPQSQLTDNRDTVVCSYEDLKDMSQMVLRTRGPRTIFTGHGLVLHVNFSDADKVGVFYGGNSIALEEYKHVLGGEKLAYAVKPSQHQEESIFYVEGLAFPDVSFSGLVAFHVTLLESPEKGLLETPIFTDTVVFRMAPWIMTPNTLAPLEVFVCSVKDNEDFVAAVSALAEEAKCPVTICPLPENRNDRWIQDEVEFGYVQAPHKMFPVVLDSPRDRGLKDFPVRSILGPDFGYVAQETPENTSSLDSFGNLEVSPPVTVRSKEYPLGRILIGSSFPGLAAGAWPKQCGISSLLSVSRRLWSSSQTGCRSGMLMSSSASSLHLIGRALGCCWPAPVPATSCSGRSRRWATGKRQCSRGCMVCPSRASARSWEMKHCASSMPMRRAASVGIGTS